MERRTKIVATIGPACDSPAGLRSLIDAGMDVARVSLSHGPVEDALTRIAAVRAAADAAGRVIGVLADLPGPKIRTAAFPDGGVLVADGAEIELVSGDVDASDDRRIAIDTPSVLSALEPGDTIALGDGAIRVVVRSTDGERVDAEVVTGGWLQGRPGVSVPEERLSLRAPTDEDIRLLGALAEIGVEGVAVSFVRSAADIARARAASGPDGPRLVAKLETREAIDAIDDIIAAADGVMVARGDLGIHCALEDVPHHQKRIIRSAVSFGRPVITATQMLESMVRAPVPTRAEVSDIANAVFDGTSAVMLSAETAIGSNPALAVRTMSTVAARAEREFDYEAWGRSVGRQQGLLGPAAPVGERITAAVSAAAWRASGDADVAAIVACTNTGATARAISRFRPRVPLFAVTPSVRTARWLALAWGVTPIVTVRHTSTDDIVWFAVKAVAESGAVKPGDVVAVLAGAPVQTDAATDTLRLVRID
jgi:pyruvate kinase